MVQAREVFPIFISLEGEHDEELGKWLLERSCRGKKRTTASPRLPAERDSLEVAHQQAEKLAVTRLAERQMGLVEANARRPRAGAHKLERYYEYKARAAEEKLDRVRTTFEKSQPRAPEVQKIIPVWAKNLETAKRITSRIESRT